MKRWLGGFVYGLMLATTLAVAADVKWSSNVTFPPTVPNIGGYVMGLQGGVNAKFAWLVNPITYVGTPTGLKATISRQTIIKGVISDTGLLVDLAGSTSLDVLTSLSFGVAEIIRIDAGDFRSTTLQTINLGSTRTLVGGIGFDLPALTSFTADNLVQMSDSWTGNLGNITALSLSAYVRGDIGFSAASLTSLSLPVWEDDLSQGFQPADLSSLPSLSLPAVLRINGGFFLSSAVALTTFSMNSGLKVVGSGFFLTNAALNQASVDGILVQLAALNGTGGTTSFDNKTINLSGGTSATPSATGLAAKATLEARGNTVTVN